MKHANSAVFRVRKHFPNVTKVVDSGNSVVVSVKASDVSRGRRNQPGQCALAQACMREFKADGALINIGFSYVVRGDTAVRFKTSNTVSREITSFDRHGDFATGKDYLLCKVPKSGRIGRKRTPQSLKTGPKTASANRPVIHRTVRIRKASR